MKAGGRRVARPAEEGAFRAIVRGRVQGVGFRYCTAREARALGVRGTVRNTPQGSVEVRAEGSLAALESLASWLRQGPPGAHVQAVDLAWEPPSGSWEGFEVAF